MKKIFLALIALTCSLSAHATIKHPFLYEASKDGVTFAILGSFHVAVDLSEFSPKTLERIRSTKTLIAEIQPDIGTVLGLLYNPASVFPIGNIATAGPVSEPNIQRLIAKGMPEGTARSMGDDACFGGMYATAYFPRVRTIDYRVYEMAYINRIRQVVLDSPLIFETAKAQYPEEPCSLNRIMDGMTDQEMEALRDKMVEAYRSGSEEATACGENKQVDYRTAAWVPQILANVAPTGTLVMVGVCHVLGDKGLLALLKQQGYSIRRVDY